MAVLLLQSTKEQKDPQQNGFYNTQKDSKRLEIELLTDLIWIQWKNNFLETKCRTQWISAHMKKLLLIIAYLENREYIAQHVKLCRKQMKVYVIYYQLGLLGIMDAKPFSL